MERICPLTRVIAGSNHGDTSHLRPLMHQFLHPQIQRGEPCARPTISDNDVDILNYWNWRIFAGGHKTRPYSAHKRYGKHLKRNKSKTKP